jgi:hypothetical protein
MSDKIGKGRNKPAHNRKTVERVQAMEAGEFNSLSVDFAKLCVAAKISPASVAKVVGVTRGAVYRWMKGSKIREERRPEVQKFVEVIKKSLDSGELPKTNRVEGDKFIESLCVQVKDSIGGRAGSPLLLRPWQKMLLGDVFARRADGRRKHRTAIIGMARKNGKSALGSGIALHALMLGSNGGEVYSCAADRDQARIVFGDAKKMI